ncbi:MAG: ABC transporter ATP-binding protein [Tissierellia bacterium]|nr:ABC transporter ATP-binding protein [Tissierellia bacterium]
MLKKYIKKNLIILLIAIISGWLEVFFTYKVMLKVGYIVDISIGKKNDSLLNTIIISTFFCALIYIFGIIKENYSQQFSINISNDLRVDYLNNLYAKKSSSYYKLNTDIYLSKIDQDIDQLRINFLLNIPTSIISIGQVIIYMIGVYLIHPYILYVSIIFYIIPILISKIFVNPLSRAQKNRSDKNSIYISKLNELLKGYIVIKQSVRKDKFIKDFSFSSMQRLDCSKKINLLNEMTFQALFANNVLTIVGIISIASFLVSKNLLNLGALISSISIVSTAANTVASAFRYSINLFAHKKLFDEIIMDISDNESEENIKNYPNLPIKIDNLSLSFKDNIIFDNLSFDIDNKKSYAIIGKSGSGKSSLAKIFIKVNDCFKGEFNFENDDIRNFNEKEIFETISYVPQDSIVFFDTLKNNISMKDDKLDPLLYKDIINKLNLKYLDDRYKDNLIDPSQLSGGERTRINFARALYKKPNLIIFDEVTTGLDPKNARRIEQLIFTLKDVSKLVITHNWNEEYLSKFDHVINLDEYKKR